MDMPAGAAGLIAVYADEAQGQRRLRMDFPHGDAPGNLSIDIDYGELEHATKIQRAYSSFSITVPAEYLSLLLSAPQIFLTA